MIEPTLNITINQINSTSEWVELLRIVLPLIAVLFASWLPLAMRLKHHKQEIRIKRELEVLDELTSFLGGYLIDFERYRNQLILPIKSTPIITGYSEMLDKDSAFTIKEALVDKEVQLGKLKYKVYGYLNKRKQKDNLQRCLDKLANMFVKCRMFTNEALDARLNVNIFNNLMTKPDREKNASGFRKNLEDEIKASKDLLNEIIDIVNEIKK